MQASTTYLILCSAAIWSTYVHFAKCVWDSIHDGLKQCHSKPYMNFRTAKAVLVWGLGMSCSPRHTILILQSYTSTLSTFEYPNHLHHLIILGLSGEKALCGVGKKIQCPTQSKCNCTTACSLVFIFNCPKKKTQQEVRAWSSIAFWEEVQDYDTTVKEITAVFHWFAASNSVHCLITKLCQAAFGRILK